MMNYTDLKKYIPEYIALVILRNTNNVNEPLEQEDVAMAFVREGFATRKDLAERALKTIGFDGLEPYIDKLNTPYEGWEGGDFTGYELTDVGIEKAQEQEEEINDYRDDQPLAEQLTLGKKRVAPAADRIVKLTHNSPPYQEAMTALDEVIEAVKNDGTNDFEEKERIQKELQAGKTLLSALRVDREKIKTTLIETLKWLGKKFAEKAIDNLAAIAIAAIAVLIGTST